MKIPHFITLLALLPFAPASGDEATHADPASLRHGIVFQEEGKFGGWPANGGMWHWGDEILVCFTKADHKEQAGHTFDKSTARNTFGRSLDGGLTWALEDARAQGIPTSPCSSRTKVFTTDPRISTSPTTGAARGRGPSPSLISTRTSRPTATLRVRSGIRGTEAQGRTCLTRRTGGSALLCDPTPEYP